jgi:hypothetical protein
MLSRIRILGTDGGFVLLPRAMQDRYCAVLEIEDDDLGLRPLLPFAAFELFGAERREHADCS